MAALDQADDEHANASADRWQGAKQAPPKRKADGLDLGLVRDISGDVVEHRLQGTLKDQKGKAVRVGQDYKGGEVENQYSPSRQAEKPDSEQAPHKPATNG